MRALDKSVTLLHVAFADMGDGNYALIAPVKPISSK
jgi:hypothetical protein